MFITAASAPAKPHCTLKGTSDDDHLVDIARAA
jgi:hypothetical protein